MGAIPAALGPDERERNRSGGERTGPHLSIFDWSMADRSGPLQTIHDQSASRGETAHELDRRERGLRAAGALICGCAVHKQIVPEGLQQASPKGRILWRSVIVVSTRVEDRLTRCTGFLSR